MLGSWEWYTQLGMFDMYMHPISSRAGRSAWWWYAILNTWPIIRKYRLYRQLIIGYDSGFLTGSAGFFLIVIRILLQRMFYLRFRYWYVIGSPYPEAPLFCQRHYMDCMRIAHHDMGYGPNLKQWPIYHKIIQDPEYIGYNAWWLQEPMILALGILLEYALYYFLVIHRPHPSSTIIDLGLYQEPSYFNFIVAGTPEGVNYLSYDIRDYKDIPKVEHAASLTEWLTSTQDYIIHWEYIFMA